MVGLGNPRAFAITSEHRKYDIIRKTHMKETIWPPHVVCCNRRLIAFITMYKMAIRQLILSPSHIKRMGRILTIRKTPRPGMIIVSKVRPGHRQQRW